MSSTELAPIDTAVAQIRSPRFLEQIADALPDGVSPERFVRVASTTLREQPELLEVDRQSLFNAIVRCAQDGLMPDGREAAIAKYGNNAGYLPMVGGIRKKAAEYGWTIRAKAIYAADEFTHSDEPPEIRHVQARPGVERGEIIGAYAVATHLDGRRQQHVMFMADIAKRRAQAQTKYVWEKWPAEMAEKTAAHALYDELPLASADRRLPRESDLESAVLVYGPAAASSPALPARITGDDDEPRVLDAVLDRPGGGEDDPPGSPPPSGDFEPEPETGGEDDVAAFVPPNGKYSAGGERGPLTLAQIAAENPGWFAWALRNVTDPPAYWYAIQAYARVHLPEQYQAEMTRRETTP